ncbi:MAG: hypothetical protein JZU64_03945 [Rhodoferax sp.]|jgi:hypothetical protein|nr:hypothetical protein [Rhodoferax sp.]
MTTSNRAKHLPATKAPWAPLKATPADLKKARQTLLTRIDNIRTEAKLEDADFVAIDGMAWHLREDAYTCRVLYEALKKAAARQQSKPIASKKAGA